MNLKRILVSGLIMTLAGLGVAVYLRCQQEPKEPVYQGRTLTYWLKAYNEGQVYIGYGMFGV